MTASILAGPAERHALPRRMARLLILALSVPAWWLLPHPLAVLAACALAVVWAVKVLGADLERYVALILLPVALVVAAGAVGWIYVVGPVVARAEATVTHVETAIQHVQDQITHLTPWSRS